MKINITDVNLCAKNIFSRKAKIVKLAQENGFKVDFSRYDTITITDEKSLIRAGGELVNPVVEFDIGLNLRGKLPTEYFIRTTIFHGSLWATEMKERHIITPERAIRSLFWAALRHLRSACGVTR